MKKLLFSLIAILAVAGGVRADDHVVIVFDTSGSMGEYMRSAKATRMKVAQDALVSVLSKVPDTTKVGILTFEGWVYDLQKVDRVKVQEAIRKCRPGGGTPLYEFIKQGGNRLLEERAKQGNVGYYKLLVVTDGEAQDNNINADGNFPDGSFKPGVLKDIISRNITVDAIGLAMRNDHALKTQINGRYMRGDDSESIESSLKKAVAEVGFDGKDGISDEIFKEIGDLPEDFVKASIKGLTDFRNHPLGELPPVKVVRDDGTVVEVPNPGMTKTTSSGGGVGWGWIILIVLGAVVGVIFVIVVISRS